MLDEQHMKEKGKSAIISKHQIDWQKGKIYYDRLIRQVIREGASGIWFQNHEIIKDGWWACCMLLELINY